MLSGLDAYLPLHNKIILGEKTYRKQDSTFWVSYTNFAKEPKTRSVRKPTRWNVSLPPLE